MKKINFQIPTLLLAVFALPVVAFSQNVGVNTDGTTPETGVMLDVKGTSPIATTAVPQNIFQVKSFDADAAALKLRLGLKTDATTTLRYGLIDVYDAGAAAYRHLALQPLGGNVGVGTAGPLSKLHILGAGEATPVEGYDITNVNVGNVLRVDASGNAVYNGGVIELGSGLGPGAFIKSGQVSGAQSRLYFGTYKGTNVMSPDLTINNTGYVGLGTTGPTTRLHVNSGDIGVGRIDGGDVTPYARLGLSNGYEQYLANNAFYNSATSQWNYVNTGGYGGMASMMYQLSGVLSFYSANNAANPLVWNQRMTILNNGNVGINTPAPAAKLEVTGTSGSTIKIVDGNQGAGKVLTSDGTGQGSWQTMSGGGGCVPSSQVFTSNGTFTVTAGSTVFVTIIGGGGGGGGGGNGGTTQNAAGGGGGGAECYFYYPVPVGNTETWTITVGAAGAAGGLNGAGGAGGTSSIVGSISGTIISTAGGAGGAAGGANSSNNGAYGGNGGNGGGAGAGGGGAGGSWSGAAWVDATSGGSVTPSCNYGPGAGGGGGEFNNNYGSIAGTGGYVLPKIGGAAGAGNYYPGGGGGASLLGAGGAGGRNNGVAASPGTGNGAGGGGGGGNGPLNYGGTSSVGGAGSSGKVIIFY